MQIRSIVEKAHQPHFLSKYNINHYLDFVTQAILPFLKKQLETSSLPFHFDELETISLCLQLLSNIPVNVLSQTPQQATTNAIIPFNTDIAELKTSVHHKINQLICEAAGIPELTLSNSPSQSLNNSQWLKLWRHLTQTTLHYIKQSHIQPDLLLFLTTQMMLTSIHILTLSRNNKTLLKDFQKQLEPLNIINVYLKIIQSKSSSPTLFNPPSPQSNVVSQLTSVTDKITILNMIQLTEHFAEKFLSRQQYQLARLTYFNHLDQRLPTQAEVMQQLSLNHSKRAIKLIRTIELLILLNAGFETGKTKILTEHLENQILYETSALNLFQSKKFLSLMKQLKHMSDTTLRPVNDSYHVEPQTSNTRKTVTQSHRLSG